jgi:hypothetical protein
MIFIRGRKLNPKPQTIMHSKKVVYLRNITSAVIIAGLVLLLYGCKTTSGPSAPVTETYDINLPPVEAPESAKIADFRLNPPQVQDLSLKKLDQSNALIMVQFAPDKRLDRRVTLTTDEGLIVLHDDGMDGDAKAGDGIYSAIVPLDVDAVVADQEAELEKLKAVAEKSGPLTVPRFRGRDIVGQDKIDFDALKKDLHSDIIRIPRFPFGDRLVQPDSTLFITDSNVVNDPTRTYDPCTGNGAQMGPWTFGYLMTQMANQSVTQVDPSDFVMNWLNNWLNNQTVNGFTVQARPAMQTLFINNWPKLANGKLDLANAPMKLLAIVNRIDLAANSAYGPVSGAEGRFIFAPEIITPQSCTVLSNFNVIVEYGVPINSCTGIRSWANQWLNLQNFTLGSSQYNAALKAITDQFTAANANPNKPNGSALDQLRTDEIALNNQWELREFHLSTTDHLLHEATVAQTPDWGAYDGILNPPGPSADSFGNYVNANAANIVAGTYTVPALLGQNPFLGGEVTNELNIDVWYAANITTESSRHSFSLNTCNACHGSETGTGFTHVTACPPGPALLSGFLTGITVTVPVPGNPSYSYNDLERRRQILWGDATSSCILLIRIPVLLMPD